MIYLCKRPLVRYGFHNAVAVAQQTTSSYVQTELIRTDRWYVLIKKCCRRDAYFMPRLCFSAAENWRERKFTTQCRSRKITGVELGSRNMYTERIVTGENIAGRMSRCILPNLDTMFFLSFCSIFYFFSCFKVSTLFSLNWPSKRIYRSIHNVTTTITIY